MSGISITMQPASLEQYEFRGGIISTGTPDGVGLGHVVRLGIDGLGEQRQLCRPAQ